MPTAAQLREQIALLHRLPERERRTMFLQVVGFKVVEIGRLTGDSPRTVERLLVAGRRTLRELRAL